MTLVVLLSMAAIGVLYALLSRLNKQQKINEQVDKIENAIIVEDERNKKEQIELNAAGEVGYVNGSEVKLIRYREDGSRVEGHPQVDIVCRKTSNDGWMCYSTIWIAKNELNTCPAVFDATTEKYFLHSESCDARNNFKAAISKLEYKLASNLDETLREKIFFTEHELLWRKKRIEYERSFPDWTYSSISKFSSNPTIHSKVWYFKSEKGEDVKYSVQNSELESWLENNKFSNGDWQNKTPPGLDYFYKSREDFFVFLLYEKIFAERKSGKACKIDLNYKQSVWDVDV